MNVPIYILAGGRSSRFGSDKARAEFGGKPLLRHVADGLRPAASDIVVVAGEEGEYDDLGLETIGDLQPGLGPLSGLHAACSHCTESVLLMTSCDMLGLRPEWVDLLAEHIGEGRAIAFKEEFWQPLFSLYETTLLPKIDAALTARTLPMQKFLDSVDAVAVPPPDEWERVVSVNSRDDLARFRREA